MLAFLGTHIEIDNENYNNILCIEIDRQNTKRLFFCIISIFNFTIIGDFLYISYVGDILYTYTNYLRL